MCAVVIIDGLHAFRCCHLLLTPHPFTVAHIVSGHRYVHVLCLGYGCGDWVHFLILGGEIDPRDRTMICITTVAAAFMLLAALEVPLETHWAHLVTTDEILGAQRFEIYLQSAVL